MDPFEAIKKERKAGKVLCGTTKDAKSVAALATAFGLKGDASLYHQVDTEMARQSWSTSCTATSRTGTGCCRSRAPRSWPRR